MRAAKISYLAAALVIWITVVYVLIVNSGIVDMSQTPDWLTP